MLHAQTFKTLPALKDHELDDFDAFNFVGMQIDLDPNFSIDYLMND